MSEQAILRRLKTVDRLRELCLALMKARKVADEQIHAVKKNTNSDRTFTKSPKDN